MKTLFAPASELSAVERAERTDMLGLIVVCVILLSAVASFFLITENINLERERAAIAAKFDAQNTCLAMAVYADATGDHDGAHQRLNDAWEVQYNGMICE